MCSARCPDWSRIRCGARPASWPRLRPGQTTAARQGRRIAGPGSGRRTADRGPGGDARVPARGAHHGVRARLRVRSAECGAAPDPRSCRKGRNASMTVTAKIDTTRPVATLINVFAVSPDRQSELVALLSHATEQTMRHQPGFVCANFHASQDGERVINYAQWESEQHYRAMLANPEARVHMDQAAEIATDVQPRLFRVESSHTG
ncbi:antibiotic biosynthesis monooxygenase family protein [Streptomyces sp. NPDC050546]|uniref:antibiotic biosynthesis monooxygenase family protein n=1 Tax=Streptomyces sp. NPDC050546 TaxID=3365628 RepID=UPI0037975034